MVLTDMTLTKENDALTIGDFIFRLSIIIGIILGIIVSNVYDNGWFFPLTAFGCTFIGLIITFIISHKFL